jgi:hypothetical protein
MMPSWIYYANFALNTLIIPLIMILWQIKNGLTRLETVVEYQQDRITRLERLQDADHGKEST